MATERLFLGTQNCDLEILHLRQQAFDPALEQRVLSDQHILRPAIAVAGAIFGTRSQFVAQKKIFSPGILESAGQGLAIEFRTKVAVRARPDVGDGCNAVLVKQRQQMFATAIRVSNGVNSFHGETRMTPAISL